MVLSVDSEPILTLNLAHPVDPNAITITCTASKVSRVAHCILIHSRLQIEIKLRKLTDEHWAQLEATEPRTCDTKTKKNWDKLEKEAVAAEETEEVTGDAAVNNLFQALSP